MCAADMAGLSMSGSQARAAGQQGGEGGGDEGEEEEEGEEEIRRMLAKASDEELQQIRDMVHPMSRWLEVTR